MMWSQLWPLFHPLFDPPSILSLPPSLSPSLPLSEYQKEVICFSSTVFSVSVTLYIRRSNNYISLLTQTHRVISLNNYILCILCCTNVVLMYEIRIIYIEHTNEHFLHYTCTCILTIIYVIII